MPGRGCWPWERSWPEVSPRLKDLDLWWLWSSIPPHNDDCWLGCPGRIVFLFQETVSAHSVTFSTPASPAVGSISQDDQSGEGGSRRQIWPRLHYWSLTGTGLKCHPDRWICIPLPHPVAMVSDLSDPGHEVDAGRRLKAGGPFKRSIRSINELGLPSLRNGLNISPPH